MTRTLDRQYYKSLDPSPFVNVLTKDGLPTGEFMANEDYSSAVQDFFFQVPADGYVEISKLRIIVSDGGNPSRNEYGNIGSTLAVGVKAFFQESGGAEEEVTPGLRAIQANQDFERIATGLDLINYSGSDSRAYEVALLGGIKMNPGDRFSIRLNDNFSGLVDHQFSIIGTQRGL